MVKSSGESSGMGYLPHVVAEPYGGFWSSPSWEVGRAWQWQQWKDWSIIIYIIKGFALPLPLRRQLWEIPNRISSYTQGFNWPITTLLTQIRYFIGWAEWLPPHWMNREHHMCFMFGNVAGGCHSFSLSVVFFLESHSLDCYSTASFRTTWR